MCVWVSLRASVSVCVCVGACMHVRVCVVDACENIYTRKNKHTCTIAYKHAHITTQITTYTHAGTYTHTLTNINTSTHGYRVR